MEEVLGKEGYPCDTASDGREALEKLTSGEFKIVLMDIKMPKMNGLAVLSEIRKQDPDLLVILMTAYGSKTVALEAIKSGAYDYFTKPFDLEEMRIVLKRAAERCRLQEKVRKLQKKAEGQGATILGESDRLQEVMKLVDKVAENNLTVLIMGESGTGKELVARAIHDRGPRRFGPFVPVNCAALSEGLVEAELFGHEKGAFTGAHMQRCGKFEAAQKGTIFLDEIAELKPSTQTKILRVLQEHEIQRVGGIEAVPVDIRVIAATNRDLTKAVSDATFREDLFFRLNVFRIDLPALRERAGDIPALVYHFLKHYAAQLKREEIKIHPEAMTMLVRHSWPGNVRELENVIQRAVVLARGNVLDEVFLGEIMLQDGVTQVKAQGNGLKDWIGEVSADAEIKIIQEALRQEQGRRYETSKRLGISRKSLYNKMRRYGLL